MDINEFHNIGGKLDMPEAYDKVSLFSLKKV